MHNNFIDLDELVVLCRDKQAKNLLQEGVACYRAGAFRSCIIATWNAVVFDYIHKLRELKILGYEDAIQELEHFENLNNARDYKGLWKFEDGIPSKARQTFEFISPIEEIDLKRLFDDRSRCAHPSVKSLEEPFEATAELARYHLRTSVIHFLEHPPIQGRRAFEQVKQDIKSVNFPTRLDDAVKFFQVSPLAKARFGLVKDIVLDFTYYLLKTNIDIEESKRLFSALNAIYHIHPLEVGQILNENLSKIILNKIADADLDKAITYIANLPNLENLNYPCRFKLNSFIKNLAIKDYNDINININILIEASKIDFVRASVIEKIKEGIIGIKDILIICGNCEDKVFCETIISCLIEEHLSSAKLRELIAIKSYSSEGLKYLIDEEIFIKLKDNTLLGLTRILIKNSINLSIDLYKPIFQEILKETTLYDLDELVDSRDYYESNGGEEEILRLFDEQLNNLFRNISFNELIEYCPSWAKIPDDLLKPILRNNISLIIDNFAKSNSFANAYKNSSFLVRSVEFITHNQWQSILNSFFDNQQIYNSYGCVGNFVTVFTKCSELHNIEQPDWLFFREELNKILYPHEEIEKLKQYIDLYFSNKLEQTVIDNY